MSVALDHHACSCGLIISKMLKVLRVSNIFKSSNLRKGVNLVFENALALEIACFRMFDIPENHGTCRYITKYLAWAWHFVSSAAFSFFFPDMWCA
jgi:hypothetical protein